MRKQIYLGSSTILAPGQLYTFRSENFQNDHVPKVAHWNHPIKMDDLGVPLFSETSIFKINKLSNTRIQNLSTNFISYSLPMAHPMYGILTYTCIIKIQPNVGKHTIHGWYGLYLFPNENLMEIHLTWPHITWATKKELLLSIEPWLFNGDPYSGWLWYPHNWVAYVA